MTSFLQVACALAILASVNGQKRGYIMTAPRIMHYDTEEKVCFNFHHVDFDIHVNLTLGSATEQHTFKQGRSECMTIQPELSRSPYRNKLHVEGHGVINDDEIYRFRDSVDVTIKKVKLMTFVQTDKPIYKPGQTVKFRILSVTPDLKPRLEGATFVWIENPNGVRMQQWAEANMNDGLISLEFALSEEPVLGKWSIHIKIDSEKISQEFEVKEYVLPKFEVTVKPPPYLLINATEYKVEICAKYTYGQSVEGHLILKSCNQFRYPYYGIPRAPSCSMLPLPGDILAIDGCQTYTIKGLALAQKRRFFAYRQTILATVIEKNTGNAVNGTGEISVTRTPLKMKFEQTLNYYKPGFVYRAKVAVTYPDGSPAEGQLVTISAENRKFNQEWSKNFTTDNYGFVAFRIPPLQSGSEQISMQVVSPEYGSSHRHEYRPFFLTPSSSNHAKQWFSPSGHFLQIDPSYKVIQCGVHTNITATYTTAGGTTKIYYQILSRGNIIDSGYFNHSSTKHHLVDENHPEMLILHGRGKVETEESNVRPEKYVTEVNIPIQVTDRMSPTTRVLIYYVLNSGEVVADSKEFNVEKCLPNKVKMEYSEEQVYPGAQTSLELHAEPGSLCAIAAVDKSVHLISKNNQLTLDKVFQELEKFDVSAATFFEDSYCMKKVLPRRSPHLGPGPPSIAGRPGGPEPLIFGGRRKRSIVPSMAGSPAGPEPVFPGGRQKRSFMPFPSWSKFVDSSEAFKDMGLVTLSDLEIDTRPCEDIYIDHRVQFSYEPLLGLPGPVQARYRGNEVGSIPKSNGPQLRNYFPETWLWSLEKIGSDGEKQIRESVPHTITDWVTAAFCTHPQVGLGVASPTKMRAFQPFFASFDLPYSVIRGERVRIIVTVFNYMSKCLAIKLNLMQSDVYEISGPSEKSLCICGKSDSARFFITAEKIGEIDLTVKAESVQDEDICETNAVMSSEAAISDAVTRKLRVKAEGKEEEYSYSSFVCPQGGTTHTENVTLPLPDNLVADSARGMLTVMGDVMGSTLTGLENLVQFPCGCGEQNMVKFAPIISVMQYLTETRQLTRDLESKALGYLKAGYQRELTYRHDDGSYSAFGSRDEVGSVWLTAFVVKSFAQAQKFIHIDSKDMLKSLNMFKDVQFENGCFPQIGTVLHKAMQGGLGRKGPLSAGLTAYILVAMLESGMEKTDQSIQDALLCLQIQESVNDTYTVALMTYALTMYDPAHPLTTQYMTKLHNLAVKEGELTHWTELSNSHASRPSHAYHQASSADVEMTAYALMAYLHSGRSRSQTISAALPIIRWLTKQRNAHGGFASTQDTVVALQALSEFATLAYGDQLNITVDAIGQEFEHFSKVTNQNSLVLQKSPIHQLPNNMTIETQGTGCAFIQANVKYNVRDIVKRNPAFSLKVGVRRVRKKKKVPTATLC